MTDAPQASPAGPQGPPKKKRSKLVPLLIAGGCLAVAVPIALIIAAVAIPAFINYVKTSKTAEAEAKLRALYASTEAYYADNGTLPGSLPRTPPSPGCESKKPWPGGADPGWEELGFSPAEPLYYAYEVDSDLAAQQLTFRAVGDLDCDGHLSTFELTAGVDDGGELYRAPGVYRVDALE